jgi:SAM-dependent methyltransferase
VAHSSLQEALTDHLAQWDLRRFSSDEAYFQWQRQMLSPHELAELHRRVEAKQSGIPADEVAFYDATAHPHILPVLYSQRYEYYFVLGPLVAAHIGRVGTILDFGCGVGILTTFYARQCPEHSFVGIDRSAASIVCAQERAKAMGLTNVRFECLDVIQQPIVGTYELIVATHALVQAEQDPGLPSRDWTTFERSHDPQLQRDFETRTSIGPRLDRLCAALAPDGKMILFEKTRQLARRIPFQRAIAARGLSLSARPEPVRYQTVEEVADDGPLFVVTNGQGGRIAWDESPEPDEGSPFDRATVRASSDDPDAPLYENHWPSAQRVWEGLQGKSITNDITRAEPGGRQWHAEFGTAEGLTYLYCANTFDQRQLLLIEPAQAALLQSYYQEIAGG